MGVKQKVKFLAQSKVYLGLTEAVESAVAAAVRLLPRPSTKSRRTHLLLPTVGGGNIGDQAMFDSYLDNVDGPVTVIFSKPDALVLPDRDEPITVVVLPRLTGGLPTLRVITMVRFSLLLRNALSYSIVGADIMDGGYDRRESILRSRSAVIASRFSVPSRILGFSWNGRADEYTVSALAKASASTRLLMRDPVSLERIRSAGFFDAEPTSDTVFCLDRSEPDTALAAWIGEGGGFAVINASGLVRRTPGMADDVVAVMTGLIDRGLRVALLPHVIRPGDDDLAACRELSERVPEAFLVDRLLSPAVVSWFASQAEFVVSGRMHLAILAMNRGTPCATLSTQGKVEGLMQLLGVPELCIDLTEGWSESLLAAASDEQICEWRVEIHHRLLSVRELAATNFSGFGDAQAPVRRSIR